MTPPQGIMWASLVHECVTGLRAGGKDFSDLDGLAMVTIGKIESAK